MDEREVQSRRKNCFCGIQVQSDFFWAAPDFWTWCYWRLPRSLGPCLLPLSSQAILDKCPSPFESLALLNHIESQLLRISEHCNMEIIIIREKPLRCPLQFDSEKQLGTWTGRAMEFKLCLMKGSFAFAYSYKVYTEHCFINQQTNS